MPAMTPHHKSINRLWRFRPQTESNRFVLDCRIESGAHLFYEMDAGGEVRHIAEPVPGCVLLSAIYPAPGRSDDDSAEDYRFHLPKRMSASQAANWLQRELGLFARLRVLVNPDHPDAARISVGPETPVALDPRFFGR